MTPRTDKDSQIEIGFHPVELFEIWRALETHLRYEMQMIREHRRDSAGPGLRIREICEKIETAIQTQDVGGEYEHFFGGDFPILSKFVTQNPAPLRIDIRRPLPNRIIHRGIMAL